MDRNKMSRYVELLNQYSVGNASLTSDDYNLINEVNQIAQNDAQALNLINQIRQAQDPNERMNLLNNYFSQNQVNNNLEQNQFTLPQSNFEVPNIQTQDTIPNNVVSFETPSLNDNINQQNNVISSAEQTMPIQDSSNVVNDYSQLASNSDVISMDTPKQLYKTQKKAGFVSPFVLSLIVGFVGGAIITTLMIILK